MPLVEGTACGWRGSISIAARKDAGHGLEAGLGDVVVVLAVVVPHMQRDAGVLGECLEELAEQLGVEAADLGARKLHLPDEIWPARDIERGSRQRLVHGKVDRGVAADALALAQRPRNRLAERDAGILDRVVVVDVQVALRPDRHVDQRMARKLLQHVVEKADAGGDFEAAGAVEIDFHRDGGLLGLAGDTGRPVASAWALGRSCGAQKSGR